MHRWRPLTSRLMGGASRGALLSCYYASRQSAYSSSALQGNGVVRPGLHVVGTPIGNVMDISERATRLFSGVDTIACEDTRVTRQLLRSIDVETQRVSPHQLSTPRAPERRSSTGQYRQPVHSCLLVVYTEHTSRRDAQHVLDRARRFPVALVSDAGTPGISDPGARLVSAAHDQGPSAVVSALSVSGLPATQFVFEGFLPRERDRRIRVLQTLLYGAGMSTRSQTLTTSSTMARTAVMFESPHRFEESTADIVEVYGGDHAVVMVREATKTHETVWRGTASELHSIAPKHSRGEITLVIAAAQKQRSPE